MKTLDEVIKAFECCGNDESDSNCEKCSYIGISCCLERDNDALHYLRKYRATMDDIEAEKMLYFKAMERETDNSPLSWDELKQMESTPVWLEWSSDGACVAWVLIAYSVYNDIKYFRYGDDRCFTLTRDEYEPGKWQAYRKEREATGGNLIPEPKSKMLGDDTKTEWRENESKHND